MSWEVENPMVRPVKEMPDVGVAFCDSCQERLFADEEFLEFEGEYFCEESCFIQYMGVRKIEGWSIK